MSYEALEAYTLATAGFIQGVYKYVMKEHFTAERAWAILGASIVAWELACPPQHTLSEGMDRFIEKHPKAVPATIGVVALHLMNQLPPRIDPLHQLLKAVK